MTVAYQDLLDSKDKLCKTVYDLRQTVQDVQGRGEEFGRLGEAVQTLTGQYRELRRQADSRDLDVRTSGSDAEAFERYTVAADQVKNRVATKGIEIQSRYVGDEERESGREFLGHKDAERAIRMVSEYDEVGLQTYGLLDDPKPTTEWQARLQYLAEARVIARAVLARQNRFGGVEPGKTPKIDAAIGRHMSRGPSWVKQVLADNSGEGAELIPDIVTPMLQRTVELPRAVAGLFEVTNTPTGGNLTYPFMTAGVQPFIAPIPTSGDLDPADSQRSVPSLTSISQAPGTLAVVLPAHLDATEDSIIAFGPLGIQLLGEALRDGKEDVWINGDINGGDTGLASWNPRGRWSILGSDNDHRKLAIGLRHASIDASSSGSLATESAVGLMAEVPTLGSGHQAGSLAFITSYEWIVLKLLTDANLLTIDKIGTMATILTGMVGTVFGHPVVASEFVDVQYNTSGIYDNSTKTKTGVLIVNRDRWRNLVRRGPRTAVEPVYRQNVLYLSATERWAPRTIDSSSTKNVSWQYNATAS